MTGFDYGNARVRARRTRLFDRDDYGELLGATSVDHLTGMLGDSVYALDIEASLPAHGGIRRIDFAVGRHAERELGEVRSFYDEPARSRLSVVLGRWDVKNIIALVRTFARRSGASAVVESLVPTGRVSRATLRELASQPGLRSMVDLMMAWHVPTRRVAAFARSALADVETAGDSVGVEGAIIRGFEEEREQAIEPAPDDFLSRVLRAERRRDDLVTAVRLRSARAHGEPTPDDAWLGAPDPDLAPLVDGEDPEALIASFTGQPSGFTAAMEGWVSHGDTARLSDDLDRQILVLASTGFSQNPLGIGVPVGYLWQVENEARNLRLVARAVSGDLDATTVTDRMVLP